MLMSAPIERRNDLPLNRYDIADSPIMGIIFFQLLPGGYIEIYTDFPHSSILYHTNYALNQTGFFAATLRGCASVL